MNQSLRALAVLLLAGCSATTPVATEGSRSTPTHPLIGNAIGLDHVLLWSRDNMAAERELGDLGFTLSAKAGSYGAGISNKLVWFKNWSFIEFLWLSDAEKARVEAPQEYAFVVLNHGSNAFGINIADADQTFTELTKAGLEPEKPGAEAWDPDGPEGPNPPIVNEWRFMFLKQPSLPGNPFFVQYKKGADAPRKETHPNGAQKLSAVWVLVRDIEQAKLAYGRASFSETVSFKSLGAKVAALPTGQGEIFLVQPGATGVLGSSLKDRGEHVHGISVQVADLEATEQLLKQHGKPYSLQTNGRFGASLLVPARPPLGLMIEFHE